MLNQFLLAKSSTYQSSSATSPCTSTTYEAPQHSESEDVIPGGPGGDHADNTNPRNSLLGDESTPTPTSSPLNQGIHSNGRLARNIYQIAGYPRKPETYYLVLSSLLHCLYVFLGFTLMNAVMTFNIWILVAVSGGIGVGYFFFRVDGKSQMLRITNQRSSTFRNAIETDAEEDDDYHDAQTVGRSPQRSPRGSLSTHKTEGEISPKSRKSKEGSLKSRHSSSTRSKRSNHESPQRRPVEVDGDESTAIVGQVIVVGAQVHNNYQQSV